MKNAKTSRALQARVTTVTEEEEGHWGEGGGKPTLSDNDIYSTVLYSKNTVLYIIIYYTVLYIIVCYTVPRTHAMNLP